MFFLLKFTVFSQVTVTPYFINFGKVRIGNLKDTTILIKSTEDDLILESFNFEYGSDSYAIDEKFPISILKGEEKTISITYKPTDSVKSYTQYTFQTNKEPIALNFLGGYKYQDTIVDASNIFTPKEGDYYLQDQDIEINWTKVKNINRYILKFTSDNGSHWTTITDSATGTSYNWKAPQVNSTQCKFQIEPYIEPEKNVLEIEWDKFIGIKRNDLSKKLIQISDGGYIIVGKSLSNDSSADKKLYNDILVVKTDMNGNQLWSKTYGSSEGEDIAYSVIEAEDKSLIIAGTTNSPDLGFDLKGKSDVIVLKLTSDGNLVWMKNYGGSLDDVGNDIVQGDNGNYYVGGYTESSDGDISSNKGKTDFLLLQIDTNGNLIWEKTYGFDKYEEIFQIKKSINGGFILFGSSNSRDNVIMGDKTGDVPDKEHCWIVKIDTNGLEKWNIQYSKGIDFAKYVTESENGDIYATGKTHFSLGDGHNIETTWLLKLNKDGGIEWVQEYPFYNSETPLGIKIKENNEILLYCLRGDSRSYYTRFMKLSATGKMSYYKDFNFNGNYNLNGFCSTYDNGIAFIGYKKGNAKDNPLGLSLVKISNEHLYKAGYSDFFEIKTLVSSINIAPNKQFITFSPNPAKNIINVDITTNLQDAVELELVSVLGRVVFSTKWQQTSYLKHLDINTNNFSNGLYFLRLITPDNLITKSVVILN